MFGLVNLWGMTKKQYMNLRTCDHDLDQAFIASLGERSLRNRMNVLGDVVRLALRRPEIHLLMRSAQRNQKVHSGKSARDDRKRGSVGEYVTLPSTHNMAGGAMSLCEPKANISVARVRRRCDQGRGEAYGKAG
jgi:hypothetical protein